MVTSLCNRVLCPAVVLYAIINVAVVVGAHAYQRYVPLFYHISYGGSKLVLMFGFYQDPPLTLTCQLFSNQTPASKKTDVAIGLGVFKIEPGVFFLQSFFYGYDLIVLSRGQLPCG